jgi:hypothetical protein
MTPAFSAHPKLTSLACLLQAYRGGFRSSHRVLWKILLWPLEESGAAVVAAKVVGRTLILHARSRVLHVDAHARKVVVVAADVARRAGTRVLGDMVR